MARIELVTTIAAPIERCFDLSRSIDLHQGSMDHTSERAIGGVTSGLIGPGESVTWRARHFGLWRTLTSRLTTFDRPRHFRDSMVAGDFARFDHDHHFEDCTDASGATSTRMTDVFDYQAPLGPLGRMAEGLFLTRYLERLLRARNGFLKEVAESTDGWVRYVGAQTLP